MQGIAHLFACPSTLKHLIHKHADAIAVVEKKNSEYRYTYVNETMNHFHHHLKGSRLEDVHDSDELKILIRFFEVADRRESPVTVTLSSRELMIHSLIPAQVYLLVEQVYSNNDQRNFQSMVDLSPDAIFVHDESHRILYVNDAGVKLLEAKSKSDLLGLSVNGFIQDEQELEVKQRLQKIFADEFASPTPLERKVKQMNGRIIEVELHGSKVQFDGKAAIQTICRNITDRRIRQERLEEMAYYDQLTKVSNRRYFFDQLQIELDAIKDRSSILSLLFIDMDNFKEINDQYGHQIGDDVLVIFTKRVQQMLRETDTFSRLGGDEFVVLLTNLHSSEDAEKIASRIMNKITQSISVQGQQLSISVSIGIAICPDHGLNRDTLLTKADQALYEAKKKGRKCVKVYQDE
ncbi:sensor domain-containing diguanylate cyclase [Halobacillus fulvus]|nr:sensor domain-containing diguanylate cyclase [Halobacillus fulvus]